jgi:hypothetical protein
VSLSERWTGHIGAPCDLTVGHTEDSPTTKIESVA